MNRQKERSLPEQTKVSKYESSSFRSVEKKGMNKILVMVVVARLEVGAEVPPMKNMILFSSRTSLP